MNSKIKKKKCLFYLVVLFAMEESLIAVYVTVFQLFLNSREGIKLIKPFAWCTYTICHLFTNVSDTGTHLSEVQKDHEFLIMTEFSFGCPWIWMSVFCIFFEWLWINVSTLYPALLLLAKGQILSCHPIFFFWIQESVKKGLAIIGK